ncbi:hypothetical protein ACIOGX_12515 [Streptomyces sp. NPDC088147]|uniref:hypothetical protein n=1 Tax=unclassified Streptomyces TaxID=2593676 RepID=UPI0033B923EA
MMLPQENISTAKQFLAPEDGPDLPETWAIHDHLGQLLQTDAATWAYPEPGPLDGVLNEWLTEAEQSEFLMLTGQADAESAERFSQWFLAVLERWKWQQDQYAQELAEQSYAEQSYGHEQPVAEPYAPEQHPEESPLQGADLERFNQTVYAVISEAVAECSAEHVVAPDQIESLTQVAYEAIFASP